MSRVNRVKKASLKAIVDKINQLSHAVNFILATVPAKVQVPSPIIGGDPKVIDVKLGQLYLFAQQQEQSGQPAPPEIDPPQESVTLHG